MAHRYSHNNFYAKRAENSSLGIKDRIESLRRIKNPSQRLLNRLIHGDKSVRQKLALAAMEILEVVLAKKELSDGTKSASENCSRS